MTSLSEYKELDTYETFNFIEIILF